MSKLCRNCEHFLKSTATDGATNEPIGLCRRYPPQVYPFILFTQPTANLRVNSGRLIGNQGPLQTQVVQPAFGWPLVKEGERCGEYQDRVSVASTEDVPKRKLEVVS